MKTKWNLLRVTSFLIILIMCLVCCEEGEEVCADCYDSMGNPPYTICAKDRIVLRAMMRLEAPNICTER